MKKNKEKGFTLIELIAVLVIMAIIALIVTPLVMSIIKKAKISADKRSIDAYGRSIELAIAGYLLDNGAFPTSIEQLTIEYSGDKVECETTQINPDSSVFLSNCKVNNREVNNYTYGSDKSPSYEAYSVGDEVTYNGVDYYVLKDSGVKDNVVTLLKATPLTTEEVNEYGGVGTDDNHVNRYVGSYPGNSRQNNVDDVNGYGSIAYYSSENCKGWGERTGCTIRYENSEIKHIVDSWKENNLLAVDLKLARLITVDEYKANCEENYYVNDSGQEMMSYEPQYNWMYSNDYSYWTMSGVNDSDYQVMDISMDGHMGVADVLSSGTVRPVVELYKNDGITRKS